MVEVECREFREEDAADVKQIINEAFYIDHYASGKLIVESALEVYLRERLLASTWVQVAVVDHRAVAIIMGQVKGQPFFGGRLRNRLRMLWHAARCGVLGIGQWKSIRQFFAFGPLYRKLRDTSGVPLTDELTLFAVSASTRGLGVGKNLYAAFLEQLREHGRQDFYLYTDSLCTYGFYEHQGMSRASELDTEVVLRGEPLTLGVYLYSGSV